MTGIVPAAPGAYAFVVYANNEDGTYPSKADYGGIEILQVPLIGWSLTGLGPKPLFAGYAYERRKLEYVLIVMSDGVVWDTVRGENFPDLTEAFDRMFIRLGYPKRIGSPQVAKALDDHKAKLEAMAERYRAERAAKAAKPPAILHEDTATDRTLN